MFTLTNARTIKPSISNAKKHYGLTAVKGERDLKVTRLDKLRRDFKNGKVLALTWATATLKGVVHRINGQHTSYLISSEKLHLPTQVILQEYHCESTEDLYDLWGLFDDSACSRNRKEVRNAVIEQDGTLAHIAKDIVGSCASALCYAKWGHNYAKVASNLDKAKIVLLFPDFCKWCSEIFPTTKRFRKVGVFYAALITYLEDKDMAEIFWNDVVNGTHSDPQNGSRLLRDVLFEHSKVREGTGTNSVPWYDLANYSLSAWIMYNQDRTAKHLVRTQSGLSGLDRFIKNKSGQILGLKMIQFKRKGEKELAYKRAILRPAFARIIAKY